MSAPYVPQVGDMVLVGKGKCAWRVQALYGGDNTALLRTGVGRLGRRGRTITAPVASLSLYYRVSA